MSIRPFQIQVPQTELADLRARLENTRWPDAADAATWAHGIPLGLMKDVVKQWQRYDWRRHEAALNALPQFVADIEGVSVHFIHVRSRAKNSTPLLLLHGFPDSFYRYHKVIALLSESFDVVVPSYPGTGFSSRVTLDADGDADILTKLMQQLGYGRFVAAGGDRGAIVALNIARRHPELAMGVHVTDVGYPDASTDFSTLTGPEMEMAQWVQQWFMEEGIGVNMIMATKPQTLAFGLSDSPVGLAAWLLSYSSSGLKGRDDFKTRFDMDELLTNVSLHWFSGSIATTMRSYQTYTASQASGPAAVPPVPTAVAHCPYDPPLPREWAARKVNLVRYTDFPRGGHFMAWEEPGLYAEDLLGFLADLMK